MTFCSYLSAFMMHHTPRLSERNVLSVEESKTGKTPGVGSYNLINDFDV